MDILDLFYNQIIREAAEGAIFCGVYYNAHFKTYIVETDEKIGFSESEENIASKTLIIRNKIIFDELLQKYVALALEKFNDYFESLELLSEEEIEEYKISKEKIILSQLFANVKQEDLKDPTEFLRGKIRYLEQREKNQEFKSTLK